MENEMDPGDIKVLEDPKAKQALDFEKPKGITIDIKHPVTDTGVHLP